MGKKKRCKGNVEKPKKKKYSCRKCGLTAAMEKHLCKPGEV
jgi:predicted nucleic-acid-binding Zn-ribbon protein